MAPARDLLAGIMSPKKLLSGTTKLFTKKLSSFVEKPKVAKTNVVSMYLSDAPMRLSLRCATCHWLVYIS